uniref:Clr5 domain-containing protein n=1 Tax=Plectus sambesii TaxID=2011161 RepID=A0A914W8N6_9BILA
MQEVNEKNESDKRRIRLSHLLSDFAERNSATEVAIRIASEQDRTPQYRCLIDKWNKWNRKYYQELLHLPTEQSRNTPRQQRNYSATTTFRRPTTKNPPPQRNQHSESRFSISPSGSLNAYVEMCEEMDAAENEASHDDQFVIFELIENILDEVCLLDTYYELLLEYWPGGDITIAFG